MDKMPKPINQGAEMACLDADATVAVLHRILHFELNGVMQHFHHHWMSRWLQSSRPRAIAIGQHIASLTGGPSVGVDALMGEAMASADEMMDAVRGYEQRRVEEYRKLLELVAGRSEGLEAFARAQIAAEEHHAAELSFDFNDARKQRPRA
jgi:bacterioferritin